MKFNMCLQPLRLAQVFPALNAGFPIIWGHCKQIEHGLRIGDRDFPCNRSALQKGESRILRLLIGVLIRMFIQNLFQSIEMPFPRHRQNQVAARFDHACQLFGDNRSEDIHHQIGRSIRKRNPEAASHRKRDLPVPLCRSAHRAFGYIKPKHPRPFPERQRQPAGVIAFSASCVQHNWRPVFPKILQRQPVQLIAKGLI